ncbi:hypothetical protein KIN20_025995 [Parelaphostrongylus tenuis]|uniref:Uncharacterized protein n=1 Tax=Parelaphostrongylus tenuis TaxID=148309 RepID=A0AAD5NC85_PARTN|nr:hypothetical protein KIN20_025995 [Parelaphostrongylus tenuis]
MSTEIAIVNGCDGRTDKRTTEWRRRDADDATRRPDYYESENERIARETKSAQTRKNKYNIMVMYLFE